MKNFYVILFLLILFSCKKEKFIINTGISKADDKLEISKKSVEGKKQIQSLEKSEEEDCIFDQATQTDDFLKGIKELEGYDWDSKRKRAELFLNDHWVLSITRGGCDHFELSAEFLYERKLDFEKDKKQIFDNIIWITSLIEEYEGDVIKEVISKEKITITKEDEFNYFVNFMDERIYESYLMSFNNEKATTFSISYYLD